MGTACLEKGPQKVAAILGAMPRQGQLKIVTFA
jgi:hypothetical protein